MPDFIRTTARYDGTVQGVGFRATTLMCADGLRVSGAVRNRPDGSVEVIAEGPPAEVDALLQRIGDKLRNRIEAVDVQRGAATGEYDGFHIAY